MGWADLVNRVTEAAQTGASFGKGAVAGVKDGVVSMATGLKDIAVGGYHLATDPAARERAKKAAAAVADYGGKFVKDPATRSKAYEQAQQIVGHARDEFVAARNQAAREGKLSEFYGKVAGRAGFEVGAFVVPVAKLGSATRVAEAGDAVADVAKVMRGGGVLADAKAGPVIAKCPSGRVPLASRAGSVGTKTLVPEYATGFSEADILGLSKGQRPDPSTYLTQSYRDAHAALFQDGGVRIQQAAPIGTIGRTETWVFPKSLADDAITSSAGDVRVLEKLLGLDEGYLGSSPVRVDIARPSGYRIPSGNEFGASSYWRPGGATWPGGLPEAVFDPVPPGGYVVKPVF